MSDEYVTRVLVEINGQAITDFKNFKENEYILRKVVNLMHKTGTAKVTPRYGFTLDYVQPASGTPFDFDSLENATVVVELEGGLRHNYSGSEVISVGETTYDGENEAMKTITFSAQKKVTE